MLRRGWFLLLFLPFVQCINIPCGKAFVPCDDELQSDTKFTRDSNVVVSHRIPDGLFWVAANEAKKQMKSLFNYTHPGFRYFKHPLATSVQQLNLIAKEDKKAFEQSQAAYTSIFITKRLTLLGLRERELRFGISPEQVTQSIGNCPTSSVERCFSTKYRSYTGICNNVGNPLWGNSHSTFSRMLKPAYGDGVTSPRESSSRGELPSVRGLSLSLFTQIPTPHESVTTLLPFWMQFISSDMVEIVETQAFIDGDSQPLPCCQAGFSHPECDAIDVPTADPAYRYYRDLEFVDENRPEDSRHILDFSSNITANETGRLNCLPHARSLVAPRAGCALGPREQVNLATSYLDASMIYGSTTDRAKQLRTFRGGQLKTLGNVGELPSTDAKLRCQAADGRCALSGSNSANILPGVTALHTIFIKQHNRIATELKNLNRQWEDDRLFDETRRIITAQIQHITYKDMVPLLVGRNHASKYGLSLHESGFDSDYDMSIEGAVLNEFAVTFPYILWSFLPPTPWNTAFNNPNRLFEPRGLEFLVRDMVKNVMLKPALRANDEVKGEFLKDNINVGLDLISIALKQGRDHGIPGYTTVRAQCGLGKVKTFDELREEFNDNVKFEYITTIYENVDDIDLLVGVMAEKPLRGALFGPTMACIASKQFQRTRRGDRFWYENFFATSGFNEDQLNEIRKTTLAEIICANSDARDIQSNVFMKENIYENMAISCGSSVLPPISVEAWRDVEIKQTQQVRQETLEKVIRLAVKNIEDQAILERKNIKQNQGKFEHGDPLFAYTNMMRAKPGAKQINKLANVLLETTRLLVKGEGIPEEERLPVLDEASLNTILSGVDVGFFVNNFTAFLSEDGDKTLEECYPRMLPCDHTTKYRTHSGWCNNLKFPHYANSFGPLRHLLPPVYDDGFSEPRKKAKSGADLPNARRISKAVCEDDPNASHEKFTHMVMQFGQLIDHELTHSPVSRGPDNDILNCSRCDSAETLSVNCIPIPVLPGDEFFPARHEPDGEPRCFPMARSLLGQLNLGYRNQLNQLTAYVDGSVIYGSTICEANALRFFTRGLMNFTDFGNGQMMLPQGGQERNCQGKDKSPCFNAGDERNSHQPGLTVMHTFWMREHNRVAMQLSALNPHWTDETVYQEARRIVTAELQHITFSEFLPKLIGLDLVNAQNLVPLKSGYFKGYDDTCDASISQPFATAAFRFGHTLIRRMFPRLDFNYKNMSEPVDLAEHFAHVGPIYEKEKGGIDSMLMGLLGTPSMAFDRHITNAVRNHLFMRRGEKHSGMDLIVLNILRAREHGVQPYNDLREFCGLPRAKTFKDLRSEMSQDAVDALQSQYDSVDDIDLFPGLVSERPLKGALLGPTMSCILAEQFGRLKKCDRFFYENDNAAAKFSAPQLAEIRKVKLSSIFCGNSKYLRTIQPNVFDMPNDLMNAQIPCSEVPQMDLSHWKERKNCEMNGRTIAMGESTHMTPCVTCTCTHDGVICTPKKVDSCEKLSHKYLLSDISKDTSCMIQCSDFVKRR